jgi:hypothetical protein
MITEKFKELVASDVRGESSEEELETLKNDTRAWLTELNKLKRDVEVQLVAQKARMTHKQIEFLETGTKLEWLKYREVEDKWKVGAVRFMVSVEDRMMFVKALRSEVKELATV